MSNQIMMINTEGMIGSANLEGDTLDTLQGLVGGLIEHLPFPVSGVDAWINEEGKYLCEPNVLATNIMRDGGYLFPGDWIAGTMVLTSSDADGNTTGLSDKQARAIINLLYPE